MKLMRTLLLSWRMNMMMTKKWNFKKVLGQIALMIIAILTNSIRKYVLIEHTYQSLPPFLFKINRKSFLIMHLLLLLVSYQSNYLFLFVLSIFGALAYFQVIIIKLKRWEWSVYRITILYKSKFWRSDAAHISIYATVFCWRLSEHHSW